MFIDLIPIALNISVILNRGVIKISKCNLNPALIFHLQFMYIFLNCYYYYYYYYLLLLFNYYKLQNTYKHNITYQKKQPRNCCF